MLKQILFVDDDRILRHLIQKKLDKYKNTFTVLTAEDGLDAVKKLAEHTISLVVTDLQMPQMDGFALMAHLSEKYADIPVIVQTGHSTPKSKRVVLERGASGYIEKPFKVEQLTEKIIDTLKKESEGGILQTIPLEMFIQLIEMEQKTCTIRVVEKKTGELGVLFFRDGDLMEARIGGRHGKQTAYEIFAWDEVTLSIQDDCAIKDKRIDEDLQAILFDAMRLKDEAGEDEEAFSEELDEALDSDPNEDLDLGLDEALDSDPSEDLDLGLDEELDVGLEEESVLVLSEELDVGLEEESVLVLSEELDLGIDEKLDVGIEKELDLDLIEKSDSDLSEKLEEELDLDLIEKLDEKLDEKPDLELTEELDVELDEELDLELDLGLIEKLDEKPDEKPDEKLDEKLDQKPGEKLDLEDETTDFHEPQPEQLTLEDSIRNKLENVIGARKCLQDIYQDNSWNDLIIQASEIGKSLEAGTLKSCYINQGEPNDFILVPGKQITVVSVDPKCPRDRILQALK